MKKQIETAYIYADGHSIEIWGKEDSHAGKINWVEIRQSYAKPTFKTGRIIFHSVDIYAYYDLAKGKRIETTLPSLKSGSQVTQEMGVLVGYISISTQYKGNWRAKEIICYQLPGLLSGNMSYMPDTHEKFEEVEKASRWCDYNITKVHFSKKEVLV